MSRLWVSLALSLFLSNAPWIFSQHGYLQQTGTLPEVVVEIPLPTRPTSPKMTPDYIAISVPPALFGIATASPQDTTSSTSRSSSTSPNPTPSGRTGCRSIPVTSNTPTGIAGCEVWGAGIASHYGPGNGVARNNCIWPWNNCGSVRITSLQTGISVIVPVTMYCDCYTGTSNERIVDLQYGVLQMLGLDYGRGLYEVVVSQID